MRAGIAVRAYQRGAEMTLGRDDMRRSQYFKLGVQYYVAARSAAICRLSPVAGNLYHHAIEMLLKGQLCLTHSEKQMKKKMGHRLDRCWAAFKALYPGEELSSFDETVTGVIVRRSPSDPTHPKSKRPLHRIHDFAFPCFRLDKQEVAPRELPEAPIGPWPGAGPKAPAGPQRPT
jgi:hypothetical protein